MEFIKKWWRAYQEQRVKDAEMKRVQDIAMHALSTGQIFPRAKERIEREMASGKNFFSSDLTVREYLLSRELGIQTIGQVMGSCFYNVSILGMMQGGWGVTQSVYDPDKFYSSTRRFQLDTGELVQITDAQLKARRLAVDRMLQEAHMMGAHGVIGVRVKASHFNWTTRMTEFTAIGTAVRVPGYENRGKVFTSDLNGQEFWQLFRAGYTPCELSFGVCSYFVKVDTQTRQMIDPTLGDRLAGKGWTNQEVSIFSQGFYEARNRAMDRLVSDAGAVKADGIVSMDVDYTIQTIESEVNGRTFHDLILHFIATGTSIVHDHERQELQFKKPLMVMSLGKNRNSGFTEITDFGVTSSMDSDDDYEVDMEE